LKFYIIFSCIPNLLITVLLCYILKLTSMYFFNLHFSIDYIDIFGTQLGYNERYTGTQTMTLFEPFFTGRDSPTDNFGRK